jgi:hypothetical protein
LYKSAWPEPVFGHFLNVHFFESEKSSGKLKKNAYGKEWSHLDSVIFKTTPPNFSNFSPEKNGIL